MDAWKNNGNAALLLLAVFSAIAALAGVGALVFLLLLFTSVPFAMLNYWVLTLDSLDAGCKSRDSWILGIAEFVGVIFGVFGALGALYSFFLGYGHSMQAANNLKSCK
ncbi:MAG: hypothetical protein KF796_06055 [Ramlibacter sp.]|nr:hypothetical protein [Ramlibacter sp.]